MIAVDTMIKHFEAGRFLNHHPDEESHPSKRKPLRLHPDYLTQSWRTRNSPPRRRGHRRSTETMASERRLQQGTLKLKDLLELCAGVLMNDLNIHPLEATTEEWSIALDFLIEGGIVSIKFQEVDYHRVFKTGVAAWRRANKAS